MATADWYYTRNNQQQGPVTVDAIRSMAASGQLQRTDLVWHEGMADWKPAAEAEGVFAAPMPMPAPTYGPAPVPPPPAPGAPPYGAPTYPAPPQLTWQGPSLGGAAQSDPNAVGRPYFGHPGSYGGYESRGESFKRTAVAAFVVSIIGLFICGLILGIVAIVQANSALRGMRISGNDEGKGLAIAARVIGIIALLGWAITLFLKFGSSRF